MPGLIGKKIGMTSVFSADGKNVPCTVIEAGPCVVTQIKTVEKDEMCIRDSVYGHEGHGTEHVKRVLGACRLVVGHVVGQLVDVVLDEFAPVSYTHLDVYKRQRSSCP